MWEAWRCSKDLRIRPSDLFGLEDGVTRFYFDRAVWSFGSAVESDIEQATKKVKNEKTAATKRLGVLGKWIPEINQSKGRYRDPAIRS